MTVPDPVSTCCGQPVTVAGRTTQYYRCGGCRCACDALPAGEARPFWGHLSAPGKAGAGAREPAITWPPDAPHLDPADIIACLTLDIEPVPKGRPRVSPAEYERVRGARVKVKKAHGYTPAKVREYEEHVGWLLRKAHVRREDSRDVCVSAAFHISKPADVDNLLKSLLDACNGVAWKDDSQVTRLGNVELVRDSPRPRTGLLIYALPGGDPDAT